MKGWHALGLGLVPLLGVVLTAGVSAAAPPGAATPVAPAGVVGGSTLGFMWGAAPGATFYYLQVNDAGASPRLARWFPAEQVCAGGSATCVVTLSAGFAAGAAIWWVQTWNPDGFGPWSSGMRLTLTHLPGAWAQDIAAAERFQLVLGGTAVLDRETGLVWERTVTTTNVLWSEAVRTCGNLSLGGRKGWRLPSLEELTSLVDPSRSNPALPAGHPFASVLAGSGFFWTSTSSPDDSSGAFYVYMPNGSASTINKTTPLVGLARWCVRGGHGIEGQ